MFRISGPDAHATAEKFSGAPGVLNKARLRPVRDIEGELIDEGLVILFKGPKSFTGEDVAEFHLHGSAAVEASFYEACMAHGLRPAEPGEFTRRALINGKLDLAEVEGLADLLDAETKLQRMQALGQFGGRLSAVAESWRSRLVAILAPLEADIDFPDEADIPAEISRRAGPEIDALIADLKKRLDEAAAGQAIRDGVKIAIIGAPNAGKSSLLNRLAGSERAIVSETPGTTRDVIEVKMDLGGMLASIFDTAGLREETSDLIEKEGIRRARLAAESANIRILIVDASAPASVANYVSRETVFERDPNVATEKEAYGLHQPGDFVVFNKIDLASARDDRQGDSKKAHRLSLKTGEGFDVFLGALTERVVKLGAADDGLLTRARHTEAVRRAIEHLSSARSALMEGPEFAAEDVRLAARALGSITGAVGVEHVLGAILSSFCIGK